MLDQVQRVRDVRIKATYRVIGGISYRYHDIYSVTYTLLCRRTNLFNVLSQFTSPLACQT